MLAAGARATSSKLWRASEVLPGSDPFVGLTRARCSRPGALAWWRVCSNQVRPFGRRSGLLLGSFRRASFPCPMRARTGVGLIYHRGRARAADDDSGWWLLRRGAARPKCGVVRPGRGRRLPQRWEEAVAGGPKAPKQNVLCTNTAPGGDADATPRERENRRDADHAPAPGCRDADRAPSLSHKPLLPHARVWRSGPTKANVISRAATDATIPRSA